MIRRPSLIFTENNTLTVLEGGKDFFPQLIQAILSAQHDVYLETYIFSNDKTGQAVHQALCDAAKRGVVVHVIVDWLGTGNTRCNMLLQTFEREGVHFRAFNPWFKRGLTRTHRKLCVVDKQTAFIGGININDDLLTEVRKKEKLPFPRWDVAIKINGPLVLAIHQLMVDQWLKIGRLSLSKRFKLFTKKALVPASYSPLTHPVIAALAPRDNIWFRYTIEACYLYALNEAKNTILLASPYFAPSGKIFRALIHAAQRGVQISLLIGRDDFQFQDAVTRAYYGQLLKHNIIIVEYDKSQLHGKLAIIDDKWASIGSANCDGLSLFVNQEANVIIQNIELCQQLTEMFLQALAEGKPFDWACYQKISWQKKVAYRCAFFIYSLIMKLIAIEDFR